MTAKGHDSSKVVQTPGLLAPSPGLLRQDSILAKPKSRLNPLLPRGTTRTCGRCQPAHQGDVCQPLVWLQGVGVPGRGGLCVWGRGRPVTHHVLPGGLVLQKFIPETLHRPHPLRGQQRLPGAQLLVLQPSPSQFSKLLQPQLLVWRVSRHVAAGTHAERDGATPNQGLVTYARSLWAKRPCEDAWERRADMMSLWSYLFRGSNRCVVAEHAQRPARAQISGGGSVLFVGKRRRGDKKKV